MCVVAFIKHHLTPDPANAYYVHNPFEDVFYGPTESYTPPVPTVRKSASSSRQQPTSTQPGSLIYQHAALRPAQSILVFKLLRGWFRLSVSLSVCWSNKHEWVLQKRLNSLRRPCKLIIQSN